MLLLEIHKITFLKMFLSNKAKLTSAHVIASKSNSQLVFSVPPHHRYKQFCASTCLSRSRPIMGSVYVCTNTRNMFTHKTININKLSC